MGIEEYNILRIKFLKAFARLPERIRSDSILVIIDDKPFTWSNAAIEVKNNSEIGRKIIKRN